MSGWCVVCGWRCDHIQMHDGHLSTDECLINLASHHHCLLPCTHLWSALHRACRCGHSARNIHFLYCFIVQLLSNGQLFDILCLRDRKSDDYQGDIRQCQYIYNISTNSMLSLSKIVHSLQRHAGRYVNL